MKKIIALCCSILMASAATASIQTIDFTASNENLWNDRIATLTVDGWGFNKAYFNTKYGNGTEIKNKDGYLSSPVFPAPITSITVLGSGSAKGQMRIVDPASNESLVVSDLPFTSMSIAFDESDNFRSFRLERECSGTAVTVVHSITIQFADAPAAPANFTAVASGSDVALNWEASTGAQSYALSYSKDGGEFTEVAALTATSHTLSGLEVGSYSFKLIALNASGYGSEAATATCAIAPAAPANLTVGEITNNGFTLTWSAVDNATYSIYLNGTLYRSQIESTALTVDGLTAGTYQITASASVNGIESAHSAAATATIEETLELVPPTLFDVEDASYLGFTAGWSQVGGEGTLYTLTVQCDGAPFAIFENIATNSLFVKITKLGIYTFSIVASKNGSTTAPSATGSVDITLSAPGSVEVSTQSQSQLAISWGDPKNAAGETPVVAGFLVKVEKDTEGNGEFAAFAEVESAASPAEIQIDSVGSYRVSVAAQVAGSDDLILTGNYSEPVLANITLPVPNVIKTAMDDCTTNSFIAKWEATEGAIAYDIAIDYPAELSRPSDIFRTTELSFAAKELESGVYGWKVRAVAEHEPFSSPYSENQTVDLTKWIPITPAISMKVASGDTGSYRNDFESAWNGEESVWSDARTIEGFYALKNGEPVSEYFTDDGGTKNRNMMLRIHHDKANYALGAHPAGTSFSFSVAFTNDSPYAVKKMRVVYTAAQYRQYKAEYPAQINFSYLTGANGVQPLNDESAWTAEKAITLESMAYTADTFESASDCYIPKTRTGEIAFDKDALAPGKVVQLRWDIPSQRNTGSDIPKVGIDEVSVEWVFARPQGTLILLF